MRIGGNESTKYWLSLLNEIKNRGVDDIMIVSVGGLPILAMQSVQYLQAQKFIDVSYIRYVIQRILLTTQI